MDEEGSEGRTGDCLSRGTSFAGDAAFIGIRLKSHWGSTEEVL
jgi:hypothetical protein